MRRFLCLFFLVLCISLSQQSFAQDFKHGITIKKTLIDYYSPFVEDGVDFSEMTHGAELGWVYNMNRWLNASVPLKFGSARLPLEGNEFAERRLSVSADAVLHLNLIDINKTVSPYLLGGAGINHTQEDDTGVQFPVGVGINFRVARGLYINLESQRRFALDDNRDNYNHAIGLILDLGKTGKEDKPKELPPLDSDGDGISDSQDECPKEAGPAALGGCPDTDSDGIADKNDDCPAVAGIAQFNGCPDADSDGVPDKDDNCPDQPGPATNNGCPLADGDNDGVVDAEDDCPTEPGPAALNGCPDNDSDGVVNKDDKCPDQAGSPELFGCPDTDSDGVADPDDKCPTKAGPASNKGCPEIEKEEKEVLEFAMQAVQFQTSRATLKSSSFEVLDQVVAIMKKYPAYSLTISGHTDSIGDSETNQLLSERRAKACYDYILSQGIAASRLSSQGFGESQPIADNRYKEGRSKNRRVEFDLSIK
ncbi:MAG: OmpA family protein [Bacteroidota bacterium]